MSAMPYLATMIVLVLISRARTGGSTATRRARNGRSSRTAKPFETHEMGRCVFSRECSPLVIGEAYEDRNGWQRSDCCSRAASALSGAAAAAGQARRSGSSISDRSAISAGPTSTRSAARPIVKEFGDKIETTYLENVSEGPDSERSIEQLARAGNKLIFTTSFGYMDPTLKVAKKYPDVMFEHATGFKRDKNMSPPIPAGSIEGRYIQGQIAAKMSKTGVLGYIGSFPIPEVISGINATMLGAQKINPDIKVKIIWVNTWFDPGKEADAAKALIDQGADVIMQHTDSPAAMQVASERGVLAFGQDSDMIKFGAEDAAHRDHQQLGALLRRARQGGARRHLEVRATPGPG